MKAPMPPKGPPPSPPPAHNLPRPPGPPPMGMLPPKPTSIPKADMNAPVSDVETVNNADAAGNNENDG